MEQPFCHCGFSLKEIKRNKRANCEECYFHFQPYFQKLLESSELDDIYILEKEAFQTQILRYLNYPEFRKNRVIFKDYPISINSLNFIDDISKQKVEALKTNNVMSIRIRYSRSLKNIKYQLTKSEMALLSYWILNHKEFNHLLNSYFEIIENHNYFTFSEQKKYINLNKLFAKTKFSYPALIRIYPCEEDHFRMDFLQFLYNKDKDNLIPDLSNFIIKIFEFFWLCDQIFLWQIHPQFGFLNQCPSNTGSGIRIYIKIPFETETRKLKLLNFLQKNWILNRLKQYTLRGSDGEFSSIEDSLIVGFDLPYIDQKKFKYDLEKRLILWLKEFNSIFNIE